MSTAVGSRPSLYSTSVGKKYAMAISGMVLMAFVLAHMVGNLKIYLGASSLDRYSHWLRQVGEPALPEQTLLWAVRIVLIVALVVHLHAAYALTQMNRRARPVKYASKRDFAAADFASRTMRWTGIIVLLFLFWHLADLTWGFAFANPDFVRGEAYQNVAYSLDRWPVALIYIVGNLALGFHLYHGTWSIFQSVGSMSPRFNPRHNPMRRGFAAGFAILVAGVNVLFPIMVLAGVVSVPS